MARVGLHIEDLANRFVLRTMLEAAGHVIVAKDLDILFSDLPDVGLEAAKENPVILLTATSQIEETLAAMQQGVYGYILVPFQAGEAEMMIERALAKPLQSPPEDDPMLPLREVERHHILAVLAHCGDNHSQAAKTLGIGRNTLWRKLKRYEAENRHHP